MPIDTGRPKMNEILTKTPLQGMASASTLGYPRELVRHRAKLVVWRRALKASVHAVLAKQGLPLDVTDLFGVGGRKLLAAAPLDAAYRLRVNALLRLIDAMDSEIRAGGGLLRVGLAGHEGFRRSRPCRAFLEVLIAAAAGGVG